MDSLYRFQFLIPYRIHFHLEVILPSFLMANELDHLPSDGWLYICILVHVFCLSPAPEFYHALWLISGGFLCHIVLSIYWIPVSQIFLCLCGLRFDLLYDVFKTHGWLLSHNLVHCCFCEHITLASRTCIWDDYFSPPIRYTPPSGIWKLDNRNEVSRSISIWFLHVL